MNLGITQNLTGTGHSDIRIRKKNRKRSAKKEKTKRKKTKRKPKRDWTGGFVGAVFGKPDGYAFA
ncbi:hypothetical protein DWX83_04720 [Ruminococcus sp. AF21-42]|nr:hypothetical protein DWX83_04720 [Ruminococcus sp. AF21-42]